MADRFFWHISNDSTNHLSSNVEMELTTQCGRKCFFSIYYAVACRIDRVSNYCEERSRIALPRRCNSERIPVGKTGLGNLIRLSRSSSVEIVLAALAVRGTGWVFNIYCLPPCHRLFLAIVNCNRSPCFVMTFFFACRLATCNGKRQKPLDG